MVILYIYLTCWCMKLVFYEHQQRVRPDVFSLRFGTVGAKPRHLVHNIIVLHENQCLSILKLTYFTYVSLVVLDSKSFILISFLHLVQVCPISQQFLAHLDISVVPC
jgi:hypothetical protein